MRGSAFPSRHHLQESDGSSCQRLSPWQLLIQKFFYVIKKTFQYTLPGLEQVRFRNELPCTQGKRIANGLCISTGTQDHDGNSSKMSVVLDFFQELTAVHERHI